MKRGKNVWFILALVLAAVVAGLDVRDWNDRGLSYGTVAVYDGGGLLAVTYVINGKTTYAIPWGPQYVLRVAWGIASLREILSGKVLWIYDSSIPRDKVELGAPESGKIRTWVYPLTVTVKDSKGRPAAGCIAKITDLETGGRWVYSISAIGSDGSVSITQAPATDYLIQIFCNGVLAAAGKFSIQRGAPATAWNIDMTVDFIETVKVSNAP